MKLSTNLKLLTKGYSIDDIRAIGAIEGITDEDAISLGEKGIPLADIQSVIELSKDQPAEVKTEEAPKTEDKPVDTTDYKSLYEAEKAKVSELQKDNSKKTVGTETQPKSDYEYLVDLFKNDVRN